VASVAVVVAVAVVSLDVVYVAVDVDVEDNKYSAADGIVVSPRHAHRSPIHRINLRLKGPLPMAMALYHRMMC